MIPSAGTPSARSAPTTGLQPPHASDSADPRITLAISRLAGEALSPGTQAVTAIAIGRCCGIEPLGQFALILATLGLLLGIQRQLMSVPDAINHRHRDGDSLRTYNASLLTHQLIWMVSVTAILMFCAALVALVAGSQPIRTATTMLCCIVPPALLVGFVREFSRNRGQDRTARWIDPALCLVQLTAIVCMLWRDAVGLPILCGIMTAACAVICGVWLRSHRSEFRMDPARVIPHWMKSRETSRSALVPQIAAGSIPFVVLWLLQATHGSAAAGRLVSSFVLVGFAGFGIMGWCHAAIPWVAQGRATGGRRTLTRRVNHLRTVSVLAASLIAVAVSVYGDQLLSWLYAGQTNQTGDTAGLLSLALLARALGTPARVGLIAADQPQENTAADIVTWMCTAAAALVIVPSYGAEGAAWAILAATAAGAMVRCLVFHNMLAQQTDVTTTEFLLQAAGSHLRIDSPSRRPTTDDNDHTPRGRQPGQTPGRRRVKVAATVRRRRQRRSQRAESR